MITGSVAKRIEAEILAAENKRLRAALGHIAQLPETFLASDEVSLRRAVEIACVALLPARPSEPSEAKP